MYDDFGDPGSAATTYLQDLFPNPEDAAPTILLWATVGWEGESEAADKGDGSDTEDGVTLVRVTTHAGALPTEPESPTGLANGHQLVAIPPMWPQWIPPKGTRCILGYPDGPTGVPVILAYYGPAPDKQHGRTTAKMDFGDQHLVIKAKSITLRDDAGNLLSMSEEMGVQIADESGSGLQAYQGVVMLRVIGGDSQTKTWVSLNEEVAQIVNAAGGTGVVCKENVVSVNGTTICLNALGAINLGFNASAATPVLVGLSAMAGVASQSIFGSP
jgi:hypothetical protein